MDAFPLLSSPSPTDGLPTPDLEAPSSAAPGPHSDAAAPSLAPVSQAAMTALQAQWKHVPSDEEVTQATAQLMASLATLARRQSDEVVPGTASLTAREAASWLMHLAGDTLHALPLDSRAALLAQAQRAEGWVGEEEKLQLETRMYQPLQPGEKIPEAVLWIESALRQPDDPWGVEVNEPLLALGLIDARHGPPQHGSSSSLTWAGTLSEMPPLGGRVCELRPKWGSERAAAEVAAATERLEWLRALPVAWRDLLRPWVSLTPEQDWRGRWVSYSQDGEQDLAKGRAPQMDRYTLGAEISLLAAWVWLDPAAPIAPAEVAALESRLDHLLDLALDRPSRTTGTAWISYSNRRDLQDLTVLITWCRQQPWGRPDFVPTLGARLLAETRQVQDLRAEVPRDTNAQSRFSSQTQGSEQDGHDANDWLRLLLVPAIQGDGAAQRAVIDLQRESVVRQLPGALWAVATALSPAHRHPDLARVSPDAPTESAPLQRGCELLQTALERWGQQLPPLSVVTLETLAACRPLESEIGRVGPAVLVSIVGEPDATSWGDRGLLSTLTPALLTEKLGLGATITGDDVATLVQRWEQPAPNASWSREKESEWPLERLALLGPVLSSERPREWARALRPLLRERLMRGGVQHEALSAMVQLAAAMPEVPETEQTTNAVLPANAPVVEVSSESPAAKPVPPPSRRDGGR